MRPRSLHFLCLQGLVLLAAVAVLARAERAPAPTAPAAPTLLLDSLGKGTAPLDGPWQFHTGDDPS